MSTTDSVYFQVTNSIGHTAEITIPVEVQKADSYDADLSLTDYLIYLPEGSRFVPETYLDSFILRGAEYSLRSGIPENFSVKITGDVHTDIPGAYPVEYKVTYTVANNINRDYDQKFTGCSRLIVVVEG